MSRPIGCQHGRATVAADPQRILDFGWWASNGPTVVHSVEVPGASSAA
jgi:hypothetical protein